MDGKQTPWRTPSRNNGANRPTTSHAAGANVSNLTGSSATTTNASSRTSSSSQKRKRHKKRRQSASGANGDVAARSQTDGKTRGDGDDDDGDGDGQAGAANVATAAEPKDWGCPACTYLNDAVRRFCEMCGTGNPTKPAPEAAPSDWSCVACTMKNAPALRVCAVCGTINPNPSMPSVLSIARHGGLMLSGSSGLYGTGDDDDDDDNDDDDDDDDDDDGDGDSSSSSGGDGNSDGSSDADSDRRLECPCVECGMTIRADQTSCSACHAPRPLPRRKLKRSDLSARLHKLTRKMAKQDKTSKKKKTKEPSAKNAYGVSSEVLTKLTAEPKSSKLVDTLQALTHTLAMMDASADSEWGDIHNSGVGAFFVHGFGGTAASDKGKDTALLGVLATIFRDEASQYSAEVRLLAMQSINYILKMDRHLFKKEEVLDVVRIYLGGLKRWGSACQTPRSKARRCAKDELMIVEECVNGLCGLCGSEGVMLREFIKPGALDDFLGFLEPLAADSSHLVHTSVVSSALELFQKCCLKIKWTTLASAPKSQSSENPRSYEQQIDLAKRIIQLLRLFLKHTLVPLHVSASKCMLLLFHHSKRSDQQPSVVSTLVTSDVVVELVEVLTSKNPEEPDDSRQAAAALLVHLLDNQREMLEAVIRDKVYEPLFDGIVAQLLQANSSASLTSHMLKLVSLLIHRVCRKSVAKVQIKSRNGKAPRGEAQRNRLRLDSSPDPDVLATLLLDFIRADSIPAVTALIKDGADLNFPSIHDSSGRELEKPLVVASEVASLSMVRFLVKRGVDVHQTGAKGTALHVAALAGRCDIVSFLLECGASPHDVDRDGQTVLKRIDDVEAGERGSSPVRKLLDLHQSVLHLGEDSDASDDDGGEQHIHGARRWLVSGEHDPFDEDEDEDEFDDDDPYMDYDDDDDEDDSEEEGHSSDEENDHHTSSARSESRKLSSPVDNKKKRRRESVNSEKSDDKSSKKARRAGRSSDTNHTAGESNADEEDSLLVSNTGRADDSIPVSPDQIESFSRKVMTSLLQTLRSTDHQNVNRGILSTLASALEMAPSSLVRALAESDISLLLETVNSLLQDPAMSSRQLSATEVAAKSSPAHDHSGSEPQSTMKASTSATQATQKAMLASYILALRILQAIVRKSIRESAVFYEIERRGICDQIERLHAHSSQFVQPVDDTSHSNNDRSGAIFGRGLQLLDFLRSNMVESGMLHLHRLKNMTRRLKELTDSTPPQEREMVLVDLVELFEEENSITSHEFKQSNLLEAIMAFVVPIGHIDPVEARVNMLLERFARSPAAFSSLITRLQAVVNQDENLPLVSFFTGKGRELYPLTKQLKIVCTRASTGKDVPTLQKMLQLSALTHFQSFEKTIFRCMPVQDAKLAAFYFSLVGHCIHKAVDGKWKKYWVCGFDPARCIHLVKPVDDADDVSEVVLHDSQFKLSTAMDIHEDISLDFSLFGELVGKDSSNDSANSSGEGKKRKRQSKKRRKSSVSEAAGGPKAVEVQNVSSINAGKMRGAWYAGELIEDSDGNAASSDSAQWPVAGRAYTVRLLTSGNTLKNVPAERIRVRTEEPQVGSVVEVDGLLGEVSRVENSDRENGKAATFDVKVSRDRERKGIVKARIRYPPSGNNKTPASSEVIEAMSLSRLFPPRESSLAAGSVGDKVWVAPRSSTGGSPPPVDLFLAGTIQSFPSGPDAIGPAGAVFMEVSFGTSTAIIEVEQSRVTNLAIGRNRLGSSRLMSALNMASEHNGSSSSQSLHRLLHSSAANNELFSSRSTPSSGSAIDHLRQLLASSSSSSSRESALNNILNGASGDGVGTTISASTDGGSDGRSKVKEDDAASRLARVWKCINSGEKKLFSRCVRPPKMSVMIGYERKDNLDTDRNCDEELGVSSALFSTSRTSDPSHHEATLTEVDPESNKSVLKVGVAETLSTIFSTFEPKDAEHNGSSAKKSKKGKNKRLKLSPPQVMGGGEGSATSGKKDPMWDVEKYSAFVAAAFGLSPLDDPEGSLVDNCIKFSLFASPSTRRRVLNREGFLAAMADSCKSVRNARHLLAYLVSHGYSAASLTGDESKRPCTGKSTTDTRRTKSASTMNPARGAEMQSFPSDQNMLRCLYEMQRATAQPADAAAPWKFKYFVQCDVSIDWSCVNKREAESSSDLADMSTPSESPHLRVINGVGTDSPMMKSVRLLSYLFQALPNSITVSDDVWRNARLSKKLEAQLEDVLSVCSGIYPDWCDAVVSECKFFFPRDLREKLFQATSFGCTRSLHWFRSQLNVDDSASSAAGAASEGHLSGPGIAADGIYNHEITISPIPKERVKVSRDNLLSSAEAIMKMHGKRKAILDIVFVGEKGYGSGVTAAFYSATAQALQSVAEDRKPNLRLWVSGIENEHEDETIRHPNGLFPFPQASDVSPKQIERFRMMGRLAGKALMDSRLFPLPLSPQFMKLVLGQRIGVEELERVFLSHGKILKSMKRAVEQLEAGVDDVDSIKVDGMPVAEWLDAVSFTFIEPLSQKPLEPNGEDKEVTLANLPSYVNKVLSLWLDVGIRAQVQAFREGISDVLPLAKLNLLFVDELLSLLCGDADIAWDLKSLTATMKLAHGYTKDSTPVQYFLQALAEMSIPQRREFLLYATGCPNLPAGGFAALRPPFEVVRRVVDTDNVDQALPFARTCTNTLHLPAYSSKQVLDERLHYAIANSAGVIDRD